jgi:hypothetical protein
LTASTKNLVQTRFKKEFAEVMEMHLEGTEVDVLEVMRELGFVK